MEMEKYFRFDVRLGIHLPKLDKSWDSYTKSEQMEIISAWEGIRAQIPVRTKEFERIFMETFELLNEANDSETIGSLSQQMGELSSIINELNVWSRQNPGLSHS